MRELGASSALGRDLLFALRMTLKNPVFSGVIVLSLSLGIGANTAIFSLIHAALLKSLPVPRAQEMVILSDPGMSGMWIGNEEGTRSLFSFPEYEYLRARSDAFSGMLASQSSSSGLGIRFEGSAPEERVQARMVSGNYFTVLGVEPALGRVFTQETDRETWAVLSYPYWSRRFALDPGVIGKTFAVGGASFAVVGVMPPEFFGETVGPTQDLWLPLRSQPMIQPGRDFLSARSDPYEKVMWLHLMARLRPGVASEAASAQVNALFGQLIESEGGTLAGDQRSEYLNQRIELKDGSGGASTFRIRFSQPLFILMGVVGLILLLACSNVATLLLVRATVREREMGIRLALGASKPRILRQMLTESVLLSLCGGLLGILFSLWAGGVLLRMVLSGPSPLSPSLRPDPAVLAFTLIVSLVTGILFGLAPAYRGLRADLNSALQQARVAGRGGSQGLGKALVAFQVALSFLLLVGAGLFLGTLQNLARQELGYDRENLFLARVDSVPAGYQEEKRMLLFQSLLERVKALPGVTAASYSENGVLSGTESADNIWLEGYSAPEGERPEARWDQVGPDYFSVLGIPILLGRGITAEDTSTSSHVAVINQTMARRFFGEASPLGKRIRIESSGEMPDLMIVGVSGDARSRSLREEVQPRFYMAVSQPVYPFAGELYLIVRTFADPSAAISAIQAAVTGLDRYLVMGSVRRIDDLVDRQLDQERLVARLSGAFSLLALLLAVVGLYGLMSYAIARRTNEIGVRMAIGAKRSQVASMVLRETAILGAIGVAAGIPMALAGAEVVSSALYGIGGLDPAVAAAAVAILLAASLTAGLLPALRAARISPVAALREQ